ncbi:MAG: hypothetical protein KKA07_10530 [Bacteroidetes bacterium]|nr:hypothetical protein [Bacteroidota bacterium]MBU1719492.1 hypothetical protein [Bacteroidota bacterium]
MSQLTYIIFAVLSVHFVPIQRTPVLTTPDLKAVANCLMQKLTTEQNLDSLMGNKWALVYHTDDRCDGSTDGSIENLSPEQVNGEITLFVSNDGAGWACTPKDPSKYMHAFSLQLLVKEWDRMEISELDEANNHFTLIGRGESDYLRVFCFDFDGKFLISKLEYRSEDPG